MDLQYCIQYKKGINNNAADALSRCEWPNSVNAISECIPSWIQRLQEGYSYDETAPKLLTELAVTLENQQGYSLKNGVIRFKGRLWVGNNTVAQQHILIALHDSRLRGHSGISATYNRVKQLFAWPGLKQSIEEFVKQCQIYQQAKTERIKSPGLLEPLPIPSQAWEIVSLDFIEGLP